MIQMKYFLKFSLLILAIVLLSCNRQADAIEAQKSELIFPKGDKVTNNNFTGTVWVQMHVNKDSIYNASIGSVTFEPGARTNWHYHPGGQILLVTAGLGHYQEKGKSVQLLHKGDVVKCPPNIEHWHGASPDSSMTHIAIGPNLQKGSVVWLQPVTDEEYITRIKDKGKRKKDKV